jgi:hypothetical protein
MKNPTTQLRIASVLCLILFSWTEVQAQLTPSGDAYTNTADPTTNYGAKTLLDVESATQTTYIQFDLSSIPSGYTGADITKATLKLYVNTVTKAGSFNVDYVNGSWSESTITADKAPALGTTIAASIPLTTADKNQYILVDITAAVQAWLNGTANDGIALVGNSPLDATFDSKESTTTSHAAELVIVFAEGGDGGITGIETASGSGLIGGGTSGTLNLSLTNTCAKSQVLQWTGTAWACASTGTGTITGVTAGTDLTGGGTSGNVTLSLNTSATNALYAQLSANNTFTGNQNFNGFILGTDGMLVSANGSSDIAVVGYATATTGEAQGVYGQTFAPNGLGVEGWSVSTTGINYGVVGGVQSPDGYGVYGGGPWIGTYGVASGPSKMGGGLGFGSGLWGDTEGKSGDFTAVLGTADGNYAGLFYNDSSPFATLFAINWEASNSNGIVFGAGGDGFGGQCIIGVTGDLGCNGKIGAVQNVDGGMRKVALYSMQSPENWFEDVGSGQLSDGSAHIALDPTFAQTVNTGIEYHVFLTPKGDSEGLYVSNETPQGFEVHEQRSGRSSIAFDYRIMAKRVGYENVRLGNLTTQFNGLEAQRQKMRNSMHSKRLSAARQQDRLLRAPTLASTRTPTVGANKQHQ